MGNRVFRCGFESGEECTGTISGGNDPPSAALREEIVFGENLLNFLGGFACESLDQGFTIEHTISIAESDSDVNKESGLRSSCSHQFELGRARQFRG